jgi:uncharacterized protein (DUF302 family)
MAMLQVVSDQPLGAAEPAVRRAARRNGASVLMVGYVGQHVPAGGDDAIVFGICSPELYGALLVADIRVSAFLPCRIAAYSVAGRVTLASVSPLEFCRMLDRPDLAPLATPLEALLLRIMEDAAEAAAATELVAAGKHLGGLGATEDQMNVRGSIPQRIDCRGSKLEDVAGTGEHDSPGG